MFAKGMERLIMKHCFLLCSFLFCTLTAGSMSAQTWDKNAIVKMLAAREAGISSGDFRIAIHHQIEQGWVQFSLDKEQERQALLKFYDRPISSQKPRHEVNSYVEPNRHYRFRFDKNRHARVEQWVEGKAEMSRSICFDGSNWIIASGSIREHAASVTIDTSARLNMAIQTLGLFGPPLTNHEVADRQRYMASLQSLSSSLEDWQVVGPIESISDPEHGDVIKMTVAKPEGDIFPIISLYFSLSKGFAPVSHDGNGGDEGRRFGRDQEDIELDTFCGSLERTYGSGR